MISADNDGDGGNSDEYGTDENDELRIRDLIFNRILENKLENLKRLYGKYSFEVDIRDDEGMTPLLHACFKGNKEIVEFLIEKGADVRNTYHKHKYTALHFAALSGNPEVCLSLMLAGAESSAVNSIGKTAAQMAAFVGNHRCVSTINNFLPKSDVEYYTIPRGAETRPKLTPVLCAPLYSFITQVNLHPVRLAMKMPRVLVNDHHRVGQVLQLMSEKEVKKGGESDEVLSFKFHYLGYILRAISKNASVANSADPVEAFVKKVLKRCRGGEDYSDFLWKGCIREFHYKEGFLFQQMIRSLARQDSSSSGLNVILSVINGQTSYDDERSQCQTCKEPKASKKCSHCEAARYCDRECQRLHWFVHKKECVRLSSKIVPVDVSNNVDLPENDDNDAAAAAADNVTDIAGKSIV